MSTNAYAQAGVDVEAGYEAVSRIKKHVHATYRKEVLGDLGGFAGLFALKDFHFDEPVLVSGTDGVGTKILLAQKLNKLDTVGIDCVAMCVNDVLAQGAEPLFFLDYISVGKNVPERMEALVKGVCDGCTQAGCSLIGGEMAEMPGLYEPEEFDLAGFCVGIAERTKLLSNALVHEGDVLIGVASSGVHSNGFSLVRSILGEELTEHPELLEPTRIYVKSVLPLIKQGLMHGVSHITGGGFVENIPRMLPAHLAAHIQNGTWDVPDVFTMLQHKGNLSYASMFEYFNMGIGLVLAVDAAQAQHVIDALCKAGEKASIIGRVEPCAPAPTSAAAATSDDGQVKHPHTPGILQQHRNIIIDA